MSKQAMDDIKFYSGVIQNMNPMFNLFIYMIRHRDIRAAIISFMLCRSSIPTATVALKPTGAMTVNTAVKR